MNERSDPAHISPTAHYTGFVWCRNGLSPPELATPTGRAMFYALAGPMRIGSLAMGGMTLEKLLLHRHLTIDHLLTTAIAAGRVGQVLEVAAGLSGRGLRITERHPDVVYVEADLPAMAERKRAMLAQLSPRSKHHVIALDALADEGPTSIFEATRPLFDPALGTAIITEGLLSYFPRAQVVGMWGRFARFLSGYRAGIYLSDLQLDDDLHRTAAVRAFRILVGAVTRGSLYVTFQSETEVREALVAAGFSDARLHWPSTFARELDLPDGPDVVSVLEAWV